jgi:ribosomal protein L24E
MAKCAYCGAMVVFGGKKDGNLRFCNSKCWKEGARSRLEQWAAEWFLQEQARRQSQAGPSPDAPAAGAG